MRLTLSCFCCLLVMMLGTSSLEAQSKGLLENKHRIEAPIQAFDGQMRQLVSGGFIVGAQVAIVQQGERIYSGSYGVVAPGSDREVDVETLFLIGSCSKPFASVCLLSLINDDAVPIGLDSKIDQWLPVFGSAKLRDGEPLDRAPTVDELLSHRAGIYSQKVGMTKPQARWIRAFDHNLETAVNGIAEYDLIAQPGARYAYSGAGYCVLGRVAELAAGKSFDKLLQERICQPLELSRTTYFPAGKYSDEEIATGNERENAPHRLGNHHRLPLIGGSLYSTAEEMSRFGQAVLDGLINDPSRVGLPVAPALFQELKRVRTPKTGYSIGWKVQTRDGQPVRLTHSGALQSYRAWIAVDLEKRISISGVWTLAMNQKRGVATKLQLLLDAL